LFDLLWDVDIVNILQTSLLATDDPEAVAERFLKQTLHAAKHPDLHHTPGDHKKLLEDGEEADFTPKHTPNKISIIVAKIVQ